MAIGPERSSPAPWLASSTTASRATTWPFLSGGLWDTLAPLAGHLGVDTLLASRMETISGRYSGKLAGQPVSDEAKTQTSRDLAAEMGLDLSQSYAYADSFSDRDLLESVGRPVAVNPDRKLRTLAQHRQWPIEVWTHNAPGHQP